MDELGISKKLQLPEKKLCMVSIQLIVSTTRIWARLAEKPYIEAFDEMMGHMQNFYKLNLSCMRPGIFKSGNYYAVYEDGTWHRTYCTHFDPATQNAAVFFVDHGSVNVYHSCKLYLLERNFCALPPQALRLRLCGLEDLFDCNEVLNYIHQLLYGRALYVKIVTCNEDQDGPIATVVLCDTSGSDDINFNLNAASHFINKCVPNSILSTRGQLYTVSISHVTKEGDVFVKNDEGYDLYIKLFKRMEHRLSLMDTTVYNVSPDAIQNFEIYLVSLNNSWHRVRVLEKTLQNLELFLIDSGKTVVISKRCLLDIRYLSAALAQYPRRVMKVYVFGIDKINVKKLIDKLVPKDEMVVMTVDSFKEWVPCVKIFRQIKPNDIPIDDSSNSDDKYDRNNVQSIMQAEEKITENRNDEIIRSLKPPKIPGVHELFEVHVTKVTDPDDFIIQPLAYRSSLYALMNLLHTVYKRHDGPLLSTVKEGQLYAAQHVDGRWYRVCMLSEIKPYMIVVYFCDYGYEKVLHMSKLRHLSNEFLKLPYQAIKAKYHGMKPIYGDWTEQEIVTLTESVMEKSFISRVMFRPAIVTKDTVLGLRLIAPIPD